MTFVFETYRQDTSVNMSGLSKSGVFLGVLDIPANSNSGSAAYPASEIGALYCVNVDAGAHDFATGVDASGYPCVSWTRRAANAAPTRLHVFSRRVVPPVGYSLMLTNDAGETLADYNYPVPQFVGTLQPAAQAAESYLCPNGMRGNRHDTGSANFRPGTNRVAMINLPDSGTQDIWYCCNSLISGSSPFQISVTVFAPSGVAYQVPTVHIFALDGPVIGTDGVGIKLFLPNTDLVYDSAAENMSVVDSTIVNYPDANSTVTYTLGLPTKAGIIIPYFYRYDGRDRYISAVKRVGNQLTFKTLYVKQLPPAPIAFANYQEGASSNGYCLVVDVAPIGASSVTGVPSNVLQSGPVINTQPASQTIVEGGTVTFNVAATGNPAPTYQWRLNGTNIAGATGTSYGFVVAIGDSGKVFSCVVTNTVNGTVYNVYSNNATLTVGSSCVPVSLLQQPNSQSVPAGQSVTFGVQASGTVPISYTWRKVGDPTVLSTTVGLTFTPTTADNGNQYYCVVSNACGTQQSNNATLTVTAALVGVAITSQPADTTVLVGANATFYCDASGSEPLVFSWYKTTGEYFYQGRTLTITAARAVDAGGFYCQVSNQVNLVNSRTATLTVNNPPNVPTITSQPQNLTRGTNQSATFTCSATGTAPLSYQWFFQTSSGWTPVGTNSSSYTVIVTSSTAGNYYCRVSNPAGFTDTNGCGITLSDTIPVISVQPQSVSTTLNTAVSLFCEASPVSEYTWHEEGGVIGSLGSGQTFYPNVTAVGTRYYNCYCTNYSYTTLSSQVAVQVTSGGGGGGGGATFPSYIGISGTSYGEDETTYFSILSDGTVDGTNTGGTSGGVFGWANPSGDGSLYEVMAVPNSSFAAQSGSAPRNTWINVGTNPTWILQPPPKVGLSKFGSLAFTVRLISTGQTVTTGTISFENYRP